MFFFLGSGQSHGQAKTSDMAWRLLPILTITGTNLYVSCKQRSRSDDTPLGHPSIYWPHASLLTLLIFYRLVNSRYPTQICQNIPNVIELYMTGFRPKLIWNNFIHCGCVYYEHLTKTSKPCYTVTIKTLSSAYKVLLHFHISCFLWFMKRQ